MEKKRLLKATEHNWSMMGPGDWNNTTWSIFYDGFYEVVSAFNPTAEEWDAMRESDGRLKLRERKVTGKMDPEAFKKLQEAMKCEPWRDPSLVVDACDGVGWEIESYKEDGSIDKTSGRLDYIYGHSVLETIVSLLPSDGEERHSSAFISVSRKE